MSKEDDSGPKVPRLKWLDPDHDRYRKSTKQEDRVAGLLGGKRLKRSGAAYWSRWEGKSASQDEKVTDSGDIVSPEFLVEHKRTRRAGYTVTKKVLDQVSFGAKQRSKDPLLVITYELGDRRLEDWAVLPLKTLLRMLGKETLE
jgi:hypothetical protein